MGVQSCGKHGEYAWGGGSSIPCPMCEAERAGEALNNKETRERKALRDQFAMAAFAGSSFPIPQFELYPSTRSL